MQMISRVFVLALAATGIRCDARVADLSPDAGAAGVRAIWDPRACGTAPRGRVELRLVDSAGTVVLADGVCIACSLDVAVPHVGWYQATAVAVDDDRDGRDGRELAAEPIAIDGPAVRWRIRAW